MLKSQPLKNSINKSAFISHQGRYECCVTLSDTDQWSLVRVRSLELFSSRSGQVITFRNSDTT